MAVPLYRNLRFCLDFGSASFESKQKIADYDYPSGLVGREDWWRDGWPWIAGFSSPACRNKYENFFCGPGASELGRSPSQATRTFFPLHRRTCASLGGENTSLFQLAAMINEAQPDGGQTVHAGGWPNSATRRSSAGHFSSVGMARVLALDMSLPVLPIFLSHDSEWALDGPRPTAVSNCKARSRR